MHGKTLNPVVGIIVKLSLDTLLSLPEVWVSPSIPRGHPLVRGTRQVGGMQLRTIRATKTSPGPRAEVSARSLPHQV